MFIIDLFCKRHIFEIFINIWIGHKFSFTYLSIRLIKYLKISITGKCPVSKANQDGKIRTWLVDLDHTMTSILICYTEIKQFLKRCENWGVGGSSPPRIEGVLLDIPEICLFKTYIFDLICIWSAFFQYIFLLSLELL